MCNARPSSLWLAAGRATMGRWATCGRACVVSNSADSVACQWLQAACESPCMRQHNCAAYCSRTAAVAGYYWLLLAQVGTKITNEHTVGIHDQPLFAIPPAAINSRTSSRHDPSSRRRSRARRQAGAPSTGGGRHPRLTASHMTAPRPPAHPHFAIIPGR